MITHFKALSLPQYVRLVRRCLCLVIVLTSVHNSIAQTFQTATNYGGLGYDVGANVVVDQQENVFLSGFYSSTSLFNTETLESNGCFDQYLLKLNSNSDLEWAKSLGGVNCDYSGGLCLDDDDNVYVSGKFQIELEIGDTLLTSNGDYDAFIAKFDTNGNLIWAKQIAGAGAESSASLIYHNGNVYMSGSFSKIAHIDNHYLTSAGKEDSYILKLNTNGAVEWIKQGGGPDSALSA